MAPGRRSDVLRRDGDPDPVVSLPPGANSHQLGDRFILTGAWEFRKVLSGTPEMVATELLPYLDLGASTLLVEGEAPFDRESLALFMTDVVPLLRQN